MPKPANDLELPPSITTLGPDPCGRVRALVLAAERQQAVETEQALATAIRVVPRPLRSIVKRVLQA